MLWHLKESCTDFYIILIIFLLLHFKMAPFVFIIFTINIVSLLAQCYSLLSICCFMPPLHLHYERISNKYLNEIYQILCWMNFIVPKVRSSTSTSNNTKKGYISLNFFHQSIYKELKCTGFIRVDFAIEVSNIVSSSPLGFDMKQLLNKRILCSWGTSGYLPPMRNFLMSKLLFVE